VVDRDWNITEKGMYGTARPAVVTESSIFPSTTGLRIILVAHCADRGRVGSLSWPRRKAVGE